MCTCEEYENLLVSIEANKERLMLLIAVHESSEQGIQQRDRIIAEYESELEADIQRHRVELARGEPSLRKAIANLVEEKDSLRYGLRQCKVAITVTGAENLRFDKLPGEKCSELETFFGYLQWTREALRQFPFSIVLWVTPEIELLLPARAADFWAWRKGVFHF